jgi:uncharacterized protein
MPIRCGPLSESGTRQRDSKRFPQEQMGESTVSHLRQSFTNGGILLRTITIIALILLIVGGLNWLLVGLFQFDLVAELFGGQSAILARIVYALVGLSAIWVLFRTPTLLDRSSAFGGDMARPGGPRDPMGGHGPGRP